MFPRVVEETFSFNSEDEDDVGEGQNLGSNEGTFGGLSVETGVPVASETPKAVTDCWNANKKVSMIVVNVEEMCLASIDGDRTFTGN